ncbi:TrkH family potassium uptake protein [Nitrospira sp. Kam-Ns4a]
MKASSMTWMPNRPLFERLLAVRLLPGQVVALAGIGMIVMGAGLLMLPWATAPGVELRFLDALFTATSAVCVTGLIVLDTPRDFTPFGQGIVLLLIQLGGLGYSTMATLLLLALGQRIGLKERMMMAEALSTLDMAGLVRFVKTIVLVTVVIEGAGALLLTLRFWADMDFARALYVGVFHSVSAFNNAGFSLFSDSLIRYRSDLTVNLVITTEIILGGIGFLVFQDVIENARGHRFRFQTHTKLAVLVSLLLLAAGTLGIWVLEWSNPRTFVPLSAGDQFLVSYFHSVSSRTAGFNTVDLSLMRDATLYFIILLMAVGGSPGSTAGGIKTTAFAIVWLSIWSILKQRADVEVFHRRIPPELVLRATCLAVLAMATVTAFTLFLAYTEQRSFLALMFEVTSAIGTVGLSTGDGGARSLSALFSDPGKSVIILTMLIGRFGPLMVGLFSVKTPSQMLYRYPVSKVVIG